MRIVAGAWRGRTLIAPSGQGTRPTADRVRQALFDMLMHAEWGGRAAIEGAVVLDVFAGTGALGLEALSRGAASACFIERDAAALKALRANVAACKAGDRARILGEDVFALSFAACAVMSDLPKPALSDQSVPSAADRGRGTSNKLAWRGEVASLVFLDPPYDQDLIPRALAWLGRVACIATKALIVAETSRDETWVPEQPLLAERRLGPARILVFRSA